jgi:hypothetical protein
MYDENLKQKSNRPKHNQQHAELKERIPIFLETTGIIDDV